MNQQRRYSEEAKIIMDCIDNEDELVHWIWNQDFFLNNNGTNPIDDNAIIGYLGDAGATTKEMERVLNVIHREQL